MINYILYILFYITSLLPMWFLYLISDLLYLIIYKIAGYRKKVVYENLTNSFLNKSKEEIESIQNKFYHHFFDVIVETIKSISANKDFFKKRIVFKNIEMFNKYYDKNQSLVLAVAHYGNWEWGLLSISISSKQKMVGIYKKLNNIFFNNLLNKIRSKFGADLIEMKKTARYLIDEKEKCKILGLLADQSPQKKDSKYWTTFLNQETSVYLGPEKISRNMNYPILFCSMNKIKRGRYEIFIEELCINPQKMSSGEITSLYLQKVEEKINQHPQYWLWTHKRWKHKK